MHGLNQYDFVARQQDSTLAGRFRSVEPMAEKYYSWSPYVYCMNNPLRFIDPDGRQVIIPPSFLAGNNPILPAARMGSMMSSNKVIRTTPRMNTQRLNQGRRIESEQLQRMGLEKNTESITRIDPKAGKEGTAIPDAIKNGQTVEIKNVKNQSYTRQLRLQEKISQESGKNPILRINKNANISKPLQNSTFEIQPYGIAPTLQDNTQDNTRKLPDPIKEKKDEGHHRIKVALENERYG